MLSAHAILSTTLAYINGCDPTAGVSAAVASEAEVTYFTNQYKDDLRYYHRNWSCCRWYCMELGI